MKKMFFVILISINFSVLGVGDTVAWGPEYHYVVKATPSDFDKTMKDIAMMLANECANSEKETAIVKRDEFLFTSFKYRNYDFFDFYCSKMSVSFTLNWNYFTPILSDKKQDVTEISLYFTAHQKEPCPEDKLKNITDKIGTILVEDPAIIKTNKIIYLKY